MALTEIKLTRQQIKEIVGDHLRKVKVFEAIIDVVNLFRTANQGSFIATADQTVAVASTPYAVEYDTEENADGVSVQNDSELLVSKTGRFLIEYSLNVSLNIGSIWTWLQLNGTNIGNTGVKYTSAVSGEQVALRQSLLYNLNQGDYIEVMYASDLTSTVVNHDVATAFSPASPASRVTIRQIS